jgi:transcriptional regulator with XRE-family HTH domain
MYKTNDRQWNKLILLRQKKGISQSELSKLVGYTQGYISLMESGERVPIYDNLLKISEALGCPIEELSHQSASMHLLDIIKSHIENLSEVEMEKVIDYIEVLKRGRR